MNSEQVADYETFCDEWLASIEEGTPTSVEKGRRFSRKLIDQWLDLPEDHDLFDCDGPGDGGIDVAVLKRDETDGDNMGGDTWFLVQSKYGTSWVNEDTALQEGIKIIKTITGKRKKLSAPAREVVDRLGEFRRRKGENDRIIVILAKVDLPTEAEKGVIDRIRQLGRQELGTMFDVQIVSLYTIYKQLIEIRQQQEEDKRLTISLRGSIASNKKNLHVGLVALTDLYQFLESYRSSTQNLDQIYEYNVRRFLGPTRKVNKAIKETLLKDPDQFGLYNNGITIVVSDFRRTEGDSCELVDPCIVNGCQTTRIVWGVFDMKLGSGGTGKVIDDSWHQKAKDGVVVVKIISMAEDTEALNLITRNANSQSAVKDIDFIVLKDDFREWQRQLEKDRDLYLEIQRGGWVSRKALQKRNKSLKQLEKFARAPDLLKVYGSGWLSLPGLAFGKNTPFLPNGEVFEKMRHREEDIPFGSDDLYAAYLLQTAGVELDFGKRAQSVEQKTSRSKAKLLFAFVMVYLLRDILRVSKKPHGESAISRALIKVLADETAKSCLTQAAAWVIDSYFEESNERALVKEQVFMDRFGNDINSFLKWQDLGKDLSKTPHLKELIEMRKMYMRERMNGSPSAREKMISALNPD